MKPPAFRYHSPSSVEEALHTLVAAGDEALLLAGGQSLLPMLNLRLANPSDLIDLGNIPGLDEITVVDGNVVIGSMVTECRVAADVSVAELVPMARQAVAHIGFPAIRNRGTVGGSIAHADPAAEWPVLALALDGRITLRSLEGTRDVAAEDFFVSLFTTSKRSDELVIAVTLSGRFAEHSGFSEFQRRTGDFATVASAVGCRLSGSDVVEARVALAGVADVPIRCNAAEASLLAGGDDLATAAAGAARDSIEAIGDSHGSAAYRKRLIFSETFRAVTQALSPRSEERLNA